MPAKSALNKDRTNIRIQLPKGLLQAQVATTTSKAETASLPLPSNQGPKNKSEATISTRA